MYTECDTTCPLLGGLFHKVDQQLETEGADDLKDQRVVLAMVVSPEGFPLWHEVFAGNKSDSTALPGMTGGWPRGP